VSDAKIVESWRRNAEPWAKAVRNNEIESRRLVTDRAIVDAVMSLEPKSVLDIGCGEGWLVRALTAKGIRAIGVDAVPDLIDQAQRAGSGDFRVASYEEIARGELDVRANVAVANFSLIGKEAVDALIARVSALLTPRGSLVIQTLHPVVACGDLPYTDGWRAGSWAGFSSDFTDPAPWYFRTIESWVRLVTESGLRLREMREPVHPATKQPASIIFSAQISG
jgi:2-polyprenyl-3-methyl-5-hydroxy-6-metoxy-1,4-benzoquinol methylase